MSRSRAEAPQNADDRWGDGFPYFKELLDASGYRGCMLLHGIRREEEFPGSTDFLRRALG